MARTKTPTLIPVDHVQLPINAVEIANSFAARDQGRPVLMNLHVVSTEEGGVVSATDGFAAATSPIPPSSGEDTPYPPGFAEPNRFVGEVLVPRSAIMAARRITDNKRPLYLRREGQRWLIGQYMRMDGTFKPDVWMTFRPTDGMKFPDMQKMYDEYEQKATEFLETAPMDHVSTLGASFLSKVDRVMKASITNDYDQTVSLGPPVTIRITSRLMPITFTAHQKENGKGYWPVKVIVMPTVVS